MRRIGLKILALKSLHDLVIVAFLTIKHTAEENFTHFEDFLNLLQK